MNSILSLVLIIFAGVGFYFFAKHFLIKQSPMIVNIFKIVFVLAIGLVTYMNYNSIDSKMVLTETVDIRRAEVKARLAQISEAQVEYKKIRGAYAGSFDDLIYFLKNDSVVQVKMEGVVPDSLIGKEAIALEMGIIKRDTTKIPVREILFAENFDEVVTNMPIIPFAGGKEFTIKATTIQKKDNKIPVFEVKAELTDVYQGLKTDNEGYDMSLFLAVGSLEEPTTNGNWKD